MVSFSLAVSLHQHMVTETVYKIRHHGSCFLLTLLPGFPRIFWRLLFLLHFIFQYFRSKQILSLLWLHLAIEIELFFFSWTEIQAMAVVSGKRRDLFFHFFTFRQQVPLSLLQQKQCEAANTYATKSSKIKLIQLALCFFGPFFFPLYMVASCAKLRTLRCTLHCQLTASNSSCVWPRMCNKITQLMHMCQHCLSRRSDFRGFSSAGSRRNQPCGMGYSSNRAMRRLVRRERRRQLGGEGDRASASEAPRSSRGRKQLACANCKVQMRIVALQQLTYFITQKTNPPATTVDADISVFFLLFAFVCAYSKMGIVGVDLTKFYGVQGVLDLVLTRVADSV